LELTDEISYQPVMVDGHLRFDVHAN